MKKILFLTICSFTFLQVEAQYTAPQGSNTGAQNITNVSFQGVNNSTSSLSKDFYNDYTYLANSGAPADAGGSFSLSVTVYNEFIGDEDDFVVWIDWNQDGTFNPTTETAYSVSQTVNASSYTFNNIQITVPPSSPDPWSGASGQYRMRIAYNWKGLSGTGTTVPAGSSTYSDAEFEDYEVNISSAPLPVKLTSFTASTEQHQVNLQWQTAMELNNSGFEVDRAAVNETADIDKSASYKWQKVGFVNGAGNSSVTQNYAFADKDVPAGKYLYRLKQVDYDGHYAYSNVVEAAILPEGFYLEQNYPNPVRLNATIRYQLAKKADVNLLLFNQQGKLIKKLVDKTQQAGSYSIDLNTANMPDGIYYYRLSAGGQEQSRKLIVIK